MSILLRIRANIIDKGRAWTVVASYTVLVISFYSPEGVSYNDRILGAMDYKCRNYRTSKIARRDNIYGIFNILAARIGIVFHLLSNWYTLQLFLEWI